jgi:hypothetical protein
MALVPPAGPLADLVPRPSRRIETALTRGSIAVALQTPSLMDVPERDGRARGISAVFECAIRHGASGWGDDDR